MSSTLLIGFGYKARNGKDTSVKHLIDTFGSRYDIRRYAFGDPLKVEVYDALDNWRNPFWTGNQPFNYLALPHPRLGVNPALEEKVAWVDANKTDQLLARLLQYWGTELRRAQDPFYWVKATRQRIDLDKPQIALIADMRFRNEFQYVCAFGGYTVKVTRLGYQLSDGRSAQHTSETQLDGIKFHFEIEVGEGQLYELKKDVEGVFAEIVKHFQPQIEEPASATTVQG